MREFNKHRWTKVFINFFSYVFTDTFIIEQIVVLIIVFPCSLLFL